MAGRTQKSGGSRTGARRRPGAGKVEEGAACPGELNLPSQSREDFADTAMEQIGEFEEKLDELESGLETSGWNDLADYRGQLEDLRLRLRTARAKSAELEAAPDREWPELRKEMEEVLLDLADSVRELSLLAGQVLQE